MKQQSGIKKHKHRICTDTHVITVNLKRNKNFPNNKLPVLIYKEVFNLPKRKNKAAVIAEKIFLRNRWSNPWQNGIYDFHHYHSNCHEAMAIIRGDATVILGGPKGKKAGLSKGDVIIIPAGVGHKCISHSDDFACVGAYPQGKDYDINYGRSKEFDKAKKRIKELSNPSKDPVFGTHGFLRSHWKLK